MDNSKRRFSIDSSVKVPDMEDIHKAVSDFSEYETVEKGTGKKNDFIARNAKHFIATDDNAAFAPELKNIKKEMVQLGMVVAGEQLEKSGSAKNEEDPQTAQKDDLQTVQKEDKQSTQKDDLQTAQKDDSAAQTQKKSAPDKKTKKQ